MNCPTFRVFWLRETGCDAGVVREAGDIDPSIRDRVLELTGGEAGEFTLRLPYLDRYEWRRRGTILKTLEYERAGRVIRAILKPADATRDLAATLALTDPAWINTPPERDRAYNGVWHRVSAAVQRALKEGIATEYFRDLSSLEKRDTAYTMVVYQCSRAFTTKIKHRYTYDLRDYPDCWPAVAASTMQIGARVERVLAQLQKRLADAGMPELARRYAPVWQQDVVQSVRRKPKRFLDLLMREAEIVNAVVDLGADRTTLSVYRCTRTMNSVLRKIQGVDARRVGVSALEEATRALTQSGESDAQDVLDGGILQDGDVGSAGSPHAGIGGEENGDNGHADGGGQMGDAGIVSDVETCGSEPSAELV